MSVAWTEPIDWAVCRPDGQASSDKGHQAERRKQTAAAYARLEVPLTLSIDSLWNVGLGHPHHYHGSDTGCGCRLDTQVQVRSCSYVHLAIQSLT